MKEVKNDDSYNPMFCEKCNKTFLKANRSHYLKTKHQEKDP